MKKYATYLIFGLWGAAAANIAPAIQEWQTATFDKKAILISSSIIFLAISFILLQRYKPQELINPYLAGPKTKDLFARNPMLSGLITMAFFVSLTTAVMLVIG